MSVKEWNTLYPALFDLHGEGREHLWGLQAAADTLAPGAVKDGVMELIAIMREHPVRLEAIEGGGVGLRAGDEEWAVGEGKSAWARAEALVRDHYDWLAAACGSGPAATNN